MTVSRCFTRHIVSSGYVTYVLDHHRDVLSQASSQDPSSKFQIPRLEISVKRYGTVQLAKVGLRNSGTLELRNSGTLEFGKLPLNEKTQS